ncbi:MAG: phospho-N-acetylmuramoyl-pentapeptide-transferase [Streptococcaceae bacterium]|jgi:phospho-N-acetylmuramoyl-pentapeptide-transferase|nr:phospho-N-acetylmuramoyl-pentapeptide-transferase [Streptococcaceae bacterium]
MVVGLILAFIVSFAATLVGIPLFMRFYRARHISGQQMHEDVHQHAAKAGTPTMGGTVFVLAPGSVALISSLVLGFFHGNFIVMTVAFAIYAIVGFLDDYLKIFRHMNQGLKVWQKFVAQIITGLICWSIFIYQHRPNVINFFGHNLHLGWVFAIFLILWLVGWSNAVNLTDGIDGLASISVSISLAAYGVIAIAQHQYDVLLVILTTIAGLLAFFIFNKKPAMLFMGDVGSLALGALLAIIAVILHEEWTLLFIGIVYVVETLSIMIQVTYFRLTHGKRIFAMTPIHHHFELGGWSGHGKKWSEWQIDYLWWGVTAGASLLTLLIYFLV